MATLMDFQGRNTQQMSWNASKVNVTLMTLRRQLTISIVQKTQMNWQLSPSSMLMRTAEAMPATPNTDPATRKWDKDANLDDERHKGLIELQRKCQFYKDIINYKINNELPEDLKEARKIVAESYQYEIGPQGLLFHLYTPRTRGVPKQEKILIQLAVPKIMRDEILRSFHDSVAGGGHQGCERTYAALQLKYFWPTM